MNVHDFKDGALTQRQEEANSGLCEALAEVAEAFGLNVDGFVNAVCQEIDTIIVDQLTQ